MIESLMFIGNVLLRSIISIVVLFILTKLMGAKQISQLTFFDYAIGISIGSIAADIAADIESSYGRSNQYGNLCRCCNYYFIYHKEEHEG